MRLLRDDLDERLFARLGGNGRDDEAKRRDDAPTFADDLADIFRSHRHVEGSGPVREVFFNADLLRLVDNRFDKLFDEWPVAHAEVSSSDAAASG